MVRCLVILLFISFFIQGEPAFPEESRAQTENECYDSWLGKDKFMHFSGSLFGTLTASTWAKHRLGYPNQVSLTAGGSTCLMIGFSKELQDMKKPDNHFCWKDLTADALGIALGLLILEVF